MSCVSVSIGVPWTGPYSGDVVEYGARASGFRRTRSSCVNWGQTPITETGPLRTRRYRNRQVPDHHVRSELERDRFDRHVQGVVIERAAEGRDPGVGTARRIQRPGGDEPLFIDSDGDREFAGPATRLEIRPRVRHRK